MENKELLTKRFIIVEMGDAKISTDEKPIIGVQALATCLGVLLYSEEKKLAIVAHVPPDEINALITIDKIFQLILDHKLTSTTFKYKIIPGYYEEHYNIKSMLEKHFSHFIPFNEDEIPDYAIQTNENYTSKEFAFDSSTGKFVTNNVYFGIEYNIINNIKKNKNQGSR
ncbi:MAG: hypothetical protein ACI31S_01620 [Bacilli bacterium]